jgi:hypothetical protein
MYSNLSPRPFPLTCARLNVENRLFCTERASFVFALTLLFHVYIFLWMHMYSGIPQCGHFWDHAEASWLSRCPHRRFFCKCCHGTSAKNLRICSTVPYSRNRFHKVHQSIDDNCSTGYDMEILCVFRPQLHGDASVSKHYLRPPFTCPVYI